MKSRPAGSGFLAFLVICSFLALCDSDAYGQQIAFPGAEGFGRFAKGGRGGRVMEVTTLNDGGPGSFRECLEASGPRTCVFRVGGEIKLSRMIQINHPYLTVAGQTAPGGGIEITGDWIAIRTGEVIFRNIRIREGNPAPDSNTGTLYVMNPDPGVWNGDNTLWSENVMLDHLSTGWSADDNLGIWGRVRNVTVQWSISAESTGGLLTSPGQDGLSVHHNLFATVQRRCPAAGGKVDVVNNVIYNYPWDPTLISGWQYGYSLPAWGNVINNYYKEGPWTKSHADYWGWNPSEVHLLYVCAPQYPNSCEASAASESYVNGNVLRRYNTSVDVPARTANDYNSSYSNPGTIRVRSTRHPYPEVTTTSPQQAYADVVAKVGAMPRDAVDQRVIGNVTNQTSPYPYMWVQYNPPGSNWTFHGWDPNTTVGWPHPAGGIAPADSDHDGMPNTWETANGLNPNNAADGPVITADGYSNLEHYLNSLMPAGSNNPVPVAINSPPSVALAAPSNNASFTAPASITLSANASDSDGNVSKVEFFRGSTLIGQDDTSPYSVTWSSVPAGSYSLTAKATDNAGAVTASSAITITVAAQQAPSYTLVATPNAVKPGGIITVNWTAPQTMRADWIALYAIGSTNTNYLAWKYINGTSSGSLSFNAPANVGTFEFRYLPNNGWTSVATSNKVIVSATAIQAPYNGIAMAIPGTIAVAKYDNGGEGVAYHDTDRSNLMSSTYRPGQGVDSEGFRVGWISASEWINYTVNVGTAGTYMLTIPLSHPGAGGTMHVACNGVNVTGSIGLPTTATWDTYQNISKTVTLSAGVQVLQVCFDTNGSTGYGPGLKDIVVTYTPTGSG